MSDSSFLSHLHSLNPTPTHTPLEIPGLKTPLRNYQKHAVQWMINREKNTQPLGVNGDGYDTLLQQRYQPPANTSVPAIPKIEDTERKKHIKNEFQNIDEFQAWQKVKREKERSRIFNLATEDKEEEEEEEEEEVAEEEKTTDIIKGGILADEMGLGKTLELIALIIANPRPLNESRKSMPEITEIAQNLNNKCLATGCDRKARKNKNTPTHITSPESYCSLKCNMNNRQTTHEENQVTDGGTLIIAPYTILQQWHKEIEMHAPQLSVFIFTGHNDLKDQNMNADHLAGFDIVLTDYSTLQREVNRAQQTAPKRLRGGFGKGWEKSFLLRVSWWRLCLDEAQEVQGYGASAEMGSKLIRVNSWAITGTPIPKSIARKDRDSAFKDFLKVFKASPRIMRNFNLEIAIPGLFWRNTKKGVEDELRLPPQHKETYFTHFTSIEKEHYSNLWTAMDDEIAMFRRNFFLKKISESYTPDDVIPGERSLRAQYLLRIRQACCHPSLSGRYQRGSAPQKTLHEVLQSMINTTTGRIWTEKGQYLSSILNQGVALTLADDTAEAIPLYKSAIKSIREEIEVWNQNLPSNNEDGNGDDEDEDAKEKTSAHLKYILHRGLFLLGSALFEIGEFDNSDSIFAEQDVARVDIMTKYEITVKRACAILRREWKVSGADLDLPAPAPINKSLQLNWLNKDFTEHRDVRRLVDYLDLSSKLILQSRKEMLTLASGSLGKDYERDILTEDSGSAWKNLFLALISKHKSLLTGIRLAGEVSIKRIRKLGYINYTQFACVMNMPHRIDDTIQEGALEDKLVPVLDETTWKDFPTTAENTSIKSCLSEIQEAQKPEQDETLPNELKMYMNHHLKFVARLEKESVFFADIWNARMLYYRALQRLSDSVAPPDIADARKHIAEELKHQTTCQGSIRSLRSKLTYLNSLEQSNQESAEEKGHECGICKESIYQGIVTSCGHFYCDLCISAWASRHQTCPLCNSRLDRYRDLLPFTLQLKPKAGQQTIEVIKERQQEAFTFPYQGLPEVNIDYGSKMDLVFRHLKYLFAVKPTAKVLVFSQWGILLNLFSKGLRLLDISFETLWSKRLHSQFTTDPAIRVLLMNASTQSSGLTLVCATHVFLLEASINPAIEAQAVGRVHRIGQTQETFVHRYIMGNSVEEAIHVMHQQAHDETDDADSDRQLSKAKGEEVSDHDVDMLLGQGRSMLQTITERRAQY